MGRIVRSKRGYAGGFRTNAQMVLVPVTVTDHNGKTIQGLRAEDFNILEDQVPQQIVSFTAEDAPCSVGLVLDISGSMRNTLDAAKGVAQSFFQTANPEDEFLLLTVSTQPEAISGFTTDIAALEESHRPHQFGRDDGADRYGLSRSEPHAEGQAAPASAADSLRWNGQLQPIFEKRADAMWRSKPMFRSTR